MNQTMQPKELLAALELIEREKKIPRETIVAGVKEAIERAYRHDVDPEANLEVDFDANTGELAVFLLMEVVKDGAVEDDLSQITETEAHKKDPSLKAGDTYRKPLPFERFAKETVRHIRQVLSQKSSEAQKDIIFAEWGSRIGSVIKGEVEQTDPESHGILVNLQSAQGYVPGYETVRDEVLEPGKRYDFFIKDVRKTTKNYPIILSRADVGLVLHLIRNECPEMQDGTVSIKSAAREAGIRTKIAVASKDETIDPVGAVVGRRGSRINTVTAQLYREKIDVIQWHDDPIKFIMAAVVPAQVAGVLVVENSERRKDATVVVPDDQLPLAIGKRGSTARLASTLTGWDLEIRSMTQAREEGIDYPLNGNMHEEKRPRPPRVSAGGSFGGGFGDRGGAPGGSWSGRPAVGRDGPRHFNIGQVFDEDVMSTYEKQASKRRPKADAPSTSPLPPPRPIERDQPSSSGDDTDSGLDTADLDELYGRK